MYPRLVSPGGCALALTALDEFSGRRRYRLVTPAPRTLPTGDAAPTITSLAEFFQGSGPRSHQETHLNVELDVVRMRVIISSQRKSIKKGATLSRLESAQTAFWLGRTFFF